LQGRFAETVVTLVAVGLVVLDLADRGVQRWWAERALATDVVAGMLVLLITTDPTTISRARLDDAVAQLRAASIPLPQVLNIEEFIAPERRFSVITASRSSFVSVCQLVLGWGDAESRSARV
jgi:hypothetical protein